MITENGKKIIKKYKENIKCPFFEKCNHYTHSFCRDIEGIIRIFCIKNPSSCYEYRDFKEA